MLHRNKPDQADDIAAEAADVAAWDDAVSSCPVAAIVEIVDDAAPETENNLAADNTDFAVVAADKLFKGNDAELYTKYKKFLDEVFDGELKSPEYVPEKDFLPSLWLLTNDYYNILYL